MVEQHTAEQHMEKQHMTEQHMKEQHKAGKSMTEQHYEHVTHTFEPVFDEHSRILILGTFPSVKSRENRFYYGHPQNRFWKVLAGVIALQHAQERTAAATIAVPQTVEEKKAFLLEHHIAIWDVIAGCDIVGSSDSSIRNVVPNDLSVILDHAPVQQIFANGGKAFELYQKYTYAKTGRDIIKLPSTSPANAAFRLEKLIECWDVIRSWL